MTGDSTRAIRAGLPEPAPYEPALPGPVFAAHYHLPGDPADAPYTYGRDGNPTWTALERAITELEAPETVTTDHGDGADGEDGTGPGGDGGDGGARQPGPTRAAAARPETVVFASGMGAIAAVLESQLRPGDAAVLPSDGYNLLTPLGEHLTRLGIEVRTAPTAGDQQADLLPGAKLLWLETPANPGLDVCDIRALAAAAHEQGALVVVDNTLATPLGQRPLALGADISVASGTKALTGHGDLLLGYATCRDAELAATVRQRRKLAGAVPGPLEAWLAHRSLATLALRTARQAENALAVARALRERGEVRGLRHPGLPEDPAHALAARQMRGGRFGCVVSFTLADKEVAERFLGALRLVDQATSFGGVRSTAERRGRWGGDAVPEGFIRLSVGAEDPANLIADLYQALDQATS